MKITLISALMIANTLSFGQIREIENEEVVIGNAGVIPAIYLGGEQALLKHIEENINYPQEAKDSGIQGRVIVEFVVDIDSTVTEARCVNRKLGLGLEKEAIRIINLTSGNWEPAKLNNVYKRMRFRIPIQFKLKD